jgi:transcriptional regulator with XRE-family HTH domain
MMIGSLLKQLRLDAGLTQKELANALNIGQSTVVGYEKNEREPILSNLALYAKYFNVSIDYLAGLENDFGVRTVEAMPEQFTQEERGIIDDYRQLNFYGKKLVKQTLDTLLLKDSSTEAKKNNN